jgi:threonine dehydratase
METTCQSEFAPVSLLEKISRVDFEQAASRISADTIITPLLPHSRDSGDKKIWLKPECLQPLGSFKIRAAANLAECRASGLSLKIATASAGNFAQGLALAARRRGLELTVHVPDNASSAKIAALKRLGVSLKVHSFEGWWQIMTTRETGSDDGMFFHPVCEPEVIVGNGTVGRELVSQLSDIDTVLVPYGGGGLISGVALALRAYGSKARIIAVEVETSTPLSAALQAGEPTTVDRLPSFVDGIGSVRVIDAMWPLVRALVDDVIVVSLKEIESAIRAAAARNALVLEGAAGAALAAALSDRCQGKRVACILSGGNIGLDELVRILTSG